jgi:hypothetical protein
MVASRVGLNSMDQNPYESPRECGASARMESGTNASSPRSTVGGVIRLLCIVFGLFVAFALWDAFVVWFIGTSH